MKKLKRQIQHDKDKRRREREDKEKAQKKEQFLSTGPDRLDTVEVNVDDMTMLIADMIGV